MTIDEFKANIERINAPLNPRTTPPSEGRSAKFQSQDLIKSYLGSNSDYYKAISEISEGSVSIVLNVKSVLNALIDGINNNIVSTITLEREVQIETVSDYLEQAEKLINDTKMHPGAAAVIIGASLEEFLRNWLEEEGADMTKIKSSLDGYQTSLKQLGLITKQDVKDIIGWGGIRNDAAHGHWDDVNDRKKIKLMMEGVNLFMRQKTPQ